MVIQSFEFDYYVLIYMCSIGKNENLKIYLSRFDKIISAPVLSFDKNG